ncbi:MAG: hypothetical protein IJX25_02400 [Clostridia bacterium]|nr:hypothetical protein [Clostridia bacterium]MBQ8792400.1 hypothetical protein [Clostridia bacterium]
MNYNDEGLLSIEQYEVMAKAYADALKKRGLKIVNIDDEIDERDVDEIFDKISNIKSLLFTLGGFLNTSTFYSLNERQLKKLLIIFDKDTIPSHHVKTRDKTKCFLSFLSCEFALTSKLLTLSEKTNFESEIKGMIHQRLTLLSQILAL